MSSKSESQDKHFQELTLMLKSRDAQERRDAVVEIGQFQALGRPFLSTLREMFQDRDPWVRFYAAAAVAAIDPTDDSGLRQMAKEFNSTSDHQIQLSILDFLGNTQSGSAVVLSLCCDAIHDS